MPTARWPASPRPAGRASSVARATSGRSDPNFKPFDLICCRNVVIYFTEQAKADLYGRFRESLRPEGILFLGATESIPNVRTIGLEPSGLTFYMRRA